MSRTFRFLLLAVSVLVALLPVAVFAQESDDDGDLLLRINGPIDVAPGETHESVVVISDDVTMAGSIDSMLLVIDGNAVVTGQVDGDVTVISGTLTLEPTARVDNVTIVDGTLVRADGAIVAGEITERSDFLNVWQLGLISAFVWLGMTLVVLVAGVVFAAVAGRQLTTAGDQIARNPGPAVLAAIVAWIAMPVLMVLAIFTLVGIPMGIGYFVFVLPVLWFTGYLVAGTQLGRLILRRRSTGQHPYGPAVLGLLILQAGSWIPWLGPVLAFVAGVVGSGALLLLAWRSWRGPETEPATQQPPLNMPAPLT